jgi:hypothetical protein
MAHEGHVINKPIKVHLSGMAYEELEGKFMEKFGRLPNADEAMTFYAIETKQCPLCGEKNLDQAVLHMMKHFEIPLDTLNRNKREE